MLKSIVKAGFKDNLRGGGLVVSLSYPFPLEFD